jgi:hypothetical protein
VTAALIAFTLRKRLMMCAVAVGVVGLLGALLIYVNAGDEDVDDNVQIMIVDGKAYKVPLASTKMYQRDLRRFGGEAAVLFDDINRCSPACGAAGPWPSSRPASRYSCRSGSSL